jgi:hypothetical protein
MGPFSKLTPLLWSAVGLAALAGISLLVGLTLLFGTVPHQRTGLRLVWISLGVLTAAGVVLTLLLTHS